MASKQQFVDYVCEQMSGAGEISARKMFGEYAVYCDEKVVGLVCDNQLFVKPTPGGKAVLIKPVEAPPYKGAKPHYLIDDALDDRDLLARLIKTTAQELPAPRPKKQRAKKKKGKK